MHGAWDKPNAAISVDCVCWDSGRKCAGSTVSGMGTLGECRVPSGHGTDRCEFWSICRLCFSGIGNIGDFRTFVVGRRGGISGASVPGNGIGSDFVGAVQEWLSRISDGHLVCDAVCIRRRVGAVVGCKGDMQKCRMDRVLSCGQGDRTFLRKTVFAALCRTFGVADDADCGAVCIAAACLSAVSEGDGESLEKKGC